MGNSEAVATAQARLASPWLTVREAADRARCGTKTIYREVKVGHLRATRVGGRRQLRFLAEWVDRWLLDSEEGYHPDTAA